MVTSIIDPIKQQQALNEFNFSDDDLLDKISFSKNIVELADKATLILDTLSKKVKTSLYEALVKDHMLYRDEFINSEYFIASKHEFSQDEDYICKFFKVFPKQYRETFKTLDEQLFNSVINKPVWEQNEFKKIVNSPLSLIQKTYLQKSKYHNTHEATQIYVEFQKNIDTDVNEQKLGVPIKTNIFQYYLIECGKEESSWDFFAPLTPIFSTLKPIQQETYVAVAISELFFKTGYSIDDSLHNVKSEKYSIESVKDSLLVVPWDLINKYCDCNNIEKKDKDSLNATLLNSKMQSTIPYKDEIKFKAIKI